MATPFSNPTPAVHNDISGGRVRKPVSNIVSSMFGSKAGASMKKLFSSSHEHNSGGSHGDHHSNGTAITESTHGIFKRGQPQRSNESLIGGSEPSLASLSSVAQQPASKRAHYQPVVASQPHQQPTITHAQSLGLISSPAPNPYQYYQHQTLVHQQEAAALTSSLANSYVVDIPGAHAHTTTMSRTRSFTLTVRA